MKNKVIVISAVNLVDGGTFTILQECLKALEASEIAKQYQIIALVHSKSNLPSDIIKYIEYPKAKKHYLFRLYYEYIGFKHISELYEPDLWLSLHDMSPRVKAKVQAVYMHNPTPFYKPKWRDWRYVPINAIWSYLYKYLYRINIHSNNYLIVQQNWIRNEFGKMFSFPQNKIIVARPVNNKKEAQLVVAERKNDITTFCYPAFPRVFKNFDVIGDAARILERMGIQNVKIVVTIDGNENGYSRYLVEKYGSCSILEFKGLVPKSEMDSLYQMTDCLLFPSKLETWGLPLSEFKPYNKPMIVADLPYAHESAAGASLVRFFNPNDAVDLADGMKAVAQGELSSFNPIPDFEVQEPCSNSWKEMFDILLGNN